MSELQNYIPAYTKGQSELFESLLPKLDKAKQNSKNALEYAKQNSTEMPSTRIHLLVEYLEELAKQNEN